MVSVAVPPDTVAVPTALPATEKVTLPAGVAAPVDGGVMSAVNVSELPADGA
jgi:hypothetical protein